MDEYKPPRNKYLDLGSKEILGGVLPLNDMDELLRIFSERKDKLTMEDFHLLSKAAEGITLQLSRNLFGEGSVSEGEVRNSIKEMSGRLLENFPEIQRIINENRESIAKGELPKVIEEILRSGQIRPGASKKENLLFMKQMLLKARKGLYDGIADPSPQVKAKVDVIIEICRKALSSRERLESVNRITGNELYNRMLSLVQKSTKVTRTVEEMLKEPRKVTRDYLVELTQDYGFLYNEAELFLKLLKAFIMVGEGSKLDLDVIRMEATSGTLNYINKRYPDLIELDPRLRNATHGGGIIILENDSKIRFGDRNKPPVTLSVEDFRKQCDRAVDSITALVQIQNVLFIILFDRGTEALDKELATSV